MDFLKKYSIYNNVCLPILEEFYSCITNTSFLLISMIFLTVLPITRIVENIPLLGITIKSISDSSENFII
jgi:hypothetical protein